MVEELGIWRLLSSPLAFVRIGKRIIGMVLRAGWPCSKYELFFCTVTKLAALPGDIFWSLITDFF
jgi:hypothetical protein